jgi:hypothetical protein
MRTTVAIDDDVLAAARALAERQRRSLGDVLSELARRGLAPSPSSAKKTRGDVPLLPMRANAAPVTLELINRLRDEVA